MAKASITTRPHRLTHAVRMGLSGMALTVGSGLSVHAQADFPREVDLATLSPYSGFSVIASDAEDNFGFFAGPAGDVSGDGDADYIVGSYAGFSGRGRVYIDYGFNRAPATLPADLSRVEPFAPQIPQPTEITAESVGDSFGYALSNAGDINGDGIDDLVIGASRSSTSADDSGRVYVVFGQDGGFGKSFDLASLDGSNGFVIDGEAQINGGLGNVVSQAGDINNDGVDDLIIGARSFNTPNGNSSGRAYVIFGKQTPFAASFDLTSLDGTNGFYMDGEAQGDNFGFAVNSLGDVNGDGIDDVIVGAIYNKGVANLNKAGRAYVIFGKTAFTQSLDVSNLGANGFVMDGVAAEDELGISVGGAGDINGDGLNDIVVGAVYNDTNGNRAGQAYVVFGKNTAFGSSVNLATLDGNTGFIVNGESAGDQFGWVSAAPGDINGDGFDDLLIGARTVMVDGQTAGRAYVMFGKENGFVPSFNVSALDGSNGFVINGVPGEAPIGRFVSFVGDVNLNNMDDIILGAPYAQENGRAYIVFGGVGGLGQTEAPTLSTTAVAFPQTAFGQPGDVQTITLKDESTLSLLQTGQLTLTGPNADAFEIVDDNCSFRKLGSGNECTFSVRVRGTVTGSLSAQVLIPSNAPGSPLSISLSATVQAPVPVPVSGAWWSVLLGGLLSFAAGLQLSSRRMLGRQGQF